MTKTLGQANAEAFDEETIRWEDMSKSYQASWQTAAEAVIAHHLASDSPPISPHHIQVLHERLKAYEPVIEVAKRALLTLQGPAGTPEQRIYAAATDLAKCLNALQEAEQQP